MKFVNTKKVVDYANELDLLKRERDHLKERLNEIKVQEEQLEEFIYAKVEGENFQFNGSEEKDGTAYVKVMEFSERKRTILDVDRAIALLARLKKKPPMKVSRWIQTSIKYVTEE
jgi:vacuolar-type H+-ATPase subunit D/Vma8